MYLKTIFFLVHLCGLSLGMHVQLGNSLSENSEDELNDITTGVTELLDSSVGQLDEGSEAPIVKDMSVFRFDYQYYPQVGWFKLHEVPADWHTARLQCKGEGATLVSPYNANIFWIIHNIQYNQKKGPLHSGVHATFSDGVFTSVDGIPMENLVIQWRLNEPNYNQTKLCTAYFNSGMGVSDCDDILPYICFRNNDVEVNECGTVDKAYSWDPETKHCYKLHNSGEPWARAQRICQAEGGYIAIINNQEEAEVLKKLFKSSKPIYVERNDWFFVGYRRWGFGDKFWTTQGQTLEEAGYVNWMNGEPNGLTRTSGLKQSCAIMSKSGIMDDDWCDLSYAFVCEKPTDSLMTAIGQKRLQI